jgi:hypothetical protein
LVPNLDIGDVLHAAAAALVAAPIAGVAFNLVRYRVKPGIPTPAGAGLGCSPYEVTGIKTSGGENSMVLQPVHERTPRGRVRGGSRLVHVGRPAFLRWLPDSLFRYYLSTAQRPPFIRSWDFASFTDRIFLLCPVIYRWTPCATSRTPAIVVAAAERRFSSSDARTNQSPKPYSGSFYNWLLLSNYSLLEYPYPVTTFNYVSRSHVH